MRSKLQAAAGVVVAALIAGTGTASAQGSYGDFELDLGTTEAGTEAKPSFVVRYRNPDDPNGKPPPIKAAVFRLPPETRIDTAAVERCTASNEEIRAAGPSACPPGSRVGAGKLSAVTGFGPPTDPVAGDVTVFNGPDQLIEVVTVPGTQTVAGMDRLTIEGNVLTAHPPATPGGPPDGRTSIKDIQLTLDRPGYVTAPPTCGSAGWGYSAPLRVRRRRDPGRLARPRVRAPSGQPARDGHRGPAATRPGGAPREGAVRGAVAVGRLPARREGALRGQARAYRRQRPGGDHGQADPGRPPQDERVQARLPGRARGS